MLLVSGLLNCGMAQWFWESPKLLEMDEASQVGGKSQATSLLLVSKQRPQESWKKWEEGSGDLANHFSAKCLFLDSLVINFSAQELYHGCDAISQTS